MFNSLRGVWLTCLSRPLAPKAIVCGRNYNHLHITQIHSVVVCCRLSPWQGFFCAAFASRSFCARPPANHCAAFPTLPSWRFQYIHSVTPSYPPNGGATSRMPPSWTNKNSPPVSGIGFRTDGLPFVTWITIAMGQLGWTQPEPKGLQIGGFWATDPDPDAGLGVKGGDRQTAPVT